MGISIFDRKVGGNRMASIKDGKLLYHLTKLNHLDSIIEHGLASRYILDTYDISFQDIADTNIIKKREMNDLNRYVPFHFHPYSPFDMAVKSKYKDDEFIYICITRDFARQNRFKILPQHPLSIENIELFDYKDGMNKIDWNTMDKKSTDPGYNRQVRMAECLSDSVVQFSDIFSIAVRDEKVKKLVEEKIKCICVKKPHINVQIWLRK